MKTLYFDLQQPGVQQVIHAKQGDTYSRFFKAVLLDGGSAYAIPEGSSFSMWFSGSVPGWYDQITEKDGTTKHSAFSVNGNEVTVELAEQMVAIAETVSACLMLNTASGVQLSMWSVIVEVEAVPGAGSSEVVAYIDVLTGKVATTLANADAAALSAADAAASAAEAQQISQQSKGWYATSDALIAAWPTGQVGWWAIVGSTDTIWVWDDTTSTWLNSGNQTDLSNYYTKTQADAEFPAGTIVLESEDPTLVPLNADTLGGQASSYYGRAADIGDVSNLTTTAKTVVPAINELNQNLADCTLLGTLTHPASGSVCTLTESIANYKALYIQYQIADDIRWTKIPTALFLATGAGKTAVQLAQIAAYIYCSLAISGKSVSVTNVTASPANWTDYFTVKIYGCDAV